MRAPEWTAEELEIANLPIDAKVASRLMGGSRSAASIAVQRERQLYDPERGLAKVVRTVALRNGHSYRRARPSDVLVEAVERRLVRHVSKTVYEITLGGIAYLNEKYGDRWRE